MKAKSAVQSLSMVIERGEVFGLLGPNGAGAEQHCVQYNQGLSGPSGVTAERSPRAQSALSGDEIRRMHEHGRPALHDMACC